MRLEPIHLKNNNRLIEAYRLQDESIASLFHYHPYNDYSKRLGDIQSREYQREELSDILLELNKEWGANEATIEQIKRLKQHNSVVVIGGQQAGLLTGPMYTMNKIISIIKLAKEQEVTLQVPVVPVFWIAGEDHDFAEINHIFSYKDQNVYKHTIKQQEINKRAITDTKIDQEQAINWLKQFLNDLPETVFTKTWYENTVESLKQSTTYVDFFARLIHQLFPKEGLVLVDSHNDQIRELEKDYFNLFIEHQEQITSEVYQTIQQLQHKGYTIPLDIGLDDANLFYHDETNERILLKKIEDHWIGKNEEVLKTTADMKRIAQEDPHKLSNNVVTRPMMQELLFPTLAFVGGNGEIAYWSTLKKAFEVFDITMPPVVPRLSFTYVTARIKKLLSQRVLTEEHVINDGVESDKLNWLTVQEHTSVDILFQEMKKSIQKIHQPVQQFTSTIGNDIASEAEQNFLSIERQVDYLKHRILKKLQHKYSTDLIQFDEITAFLRPNGLLQERVWNPFYFINIHGIDFIQQIIDAEDISLQETHYVIYL